MIGDCPPALFDLATQCCDMDPDKRYTSGVCVGGVWHLWIHIYVCPVLACDQSSPLQA